MISEVTRQQIRRFRSVPRAWISLCLLTGLYVLSLCSEQIANDKPLLVHYHNTWYFPTLHFYASDVFGGPYHTEADYKALLQDPKFTGWMLFPPIPHGPLTPDLHAPGNPPHAPSREHWLGTDSSARDVLARLLYGFRTSMTFALCLACIEVVLGSLIGGVQGYAGGKIDLTLQRLIEIWSALPFLYVVILLGAIYGQGLAILLLIFSLFQWISLSYYLRGEFYRLKNLTFVEAAQSQGASHFSILFRHILPNALNPVITILPFSLIGSISALTSLDFLGFGLPPPAPSWGELLSEGLAYLYAPWLAVSSVAALFFTLLLASFIGEGVRDAFDPKSTQKTK